jgi:hypothetical protein
MIAFEQAHSIIAGTSFIPSPLANGALYFLFMWRIFIYLAEKWTHRLRSSLCTGAYFLASFAIKAHIQFAISIFSSIPYSSSCFSFRAWFITELVITLVSYDEFFHCIFAFVVLMSIYNTSRKVSSNRISVNKFCEELTPNFPLIQ